MNRLRIIFMGSADLARATLKALHRADFIELLAVVTQPDKPKGRDLKLGPTPVGQLAAELKLPVHKPPRARDPEFIERIRGLVPDLLVVVAYGQILPPALLDVPRLGCLNVHTSLLPKYRGAAPIQWAIVNGECETGVSLMQMDAGLDTGPVVAEVRAPISDDDNSQTLHDRLAKLGADLLIRALPDFAAGRIQPIPQPREGGTYARKITKQDGRIDWSRGAREIFNQIRGFNPWPGAFTHIGVGEKSRLLKLWRARVDENGNGKPGEIIESSPDNLTIACGFGALRIEELQLEGARRLNARDFRSGHAIEPGTILG